MLKAFSSVAWRSRVGVLGILAMVVSIGVGHVLAAEDVDKGLREALKLAFELRESQDLAGEDSREEYKQLRIEAYRDLLADILKPFLQKFREIPVNDGKIHQVKLNTLGQRFDAITFRVPDGASAWDFNWEFVFSGDSNLQGWYIIPLEGQLRQGFWGRPKSARDVRMQGVDLPESNLHVMQSLPDGSLSGTGRYLIWFTFKDEKPNDAFVRVDLAKSKQQPNEEATRRAETFRTRAYRLMVLSAGSTEVMHNLAVYRLLEKTLRPVAKELPLLSADGEFHMFTSVAVENGSFQAVRFSSPPGSEPIILEWDLVFPGSRGGYWFFPDVKADKPIQKFSNSRFPGVQLPAENTHFAGPTGSGEGYKLKPSTDYLIAFRSTDALSHNFFIRAKFVKGTVSNKNSNKPTPP